MALITPQAVTRTGMIPVYQAAAAGGDTVPCGPTTFLHVKNTSAGAVTVTIVTPGTVANLAIADTAVSVAATTGESMIGPITQDLYGNAAGIASITYSAAAGVTVSTFSV